MKKMLLSIILVYNIFLGTMMSSDLLAEHKDWNNKTIEERRKELKTIRPDLIINEEALKNAKSWGEYWDWKELKERKFKLKIRKEVIERKIKTYPLNIQNLIKEKKVTIGMTYEQVLLSWGEPYMINKSVGKWGIHEQWIYSGQYLYFENGILTSYQTTR